MPIRNLQDFVTRTLGLLDRGGNAVSLRLNEPHIGEFNLRRGIGFNRNRRTLTEPHAGEVNLNIRQNGESRSRFRVDEPHSRDTLLQLNGKGISRTEVPNINKDS